MRIDENKAIKREGRRRNKKEDCEKNERTNTTFKKKETKN